MALNKYFINHNSKYEQNLIEDLVVETIKIHGFDVYYLPRELNSQPDIFGDDPTSSFRQHFVVEMYLQSVDGFEGDGDYIGKFGLEIRDSATFVVSKKRFQAVSGKFRPFEGDILYFPHTKKFFEIKFVEHENPFYQMGKNYVYSLNVELFQYSQEDINTNIEEIDKEIDKYDYNVQLAFSNLIGSEFSKGEVVYSFDNGSTGGLVGQASSRGTISKYDSTNNFLELENVYGEWRESSDTTNYFVISNSGSYAKIEEVSDNISQNPSNADNVVIDNKEDDFLDFSEINPFGDMF